MEDRMQKGADKWRTELFKPRLERWEGEQIEPVGPLEKWETVASMDAEGSMEQSGDKKDTGTDSHYPGNHYVDSRLLDTGR